MEYGLDVIFCPRFVPSRTNCTLVIEPSELDTVAVAVTDVPETFAPFTGTLIDTVDAVVPVLLTLRLIEAAVF